MTDLDKILNRYEKGYIKQNFNGSKSMADQYKKHDFDYLINLVKNKKL